MSDPQPVRWQDFTPEDAAEIDLRVRLDITAPVNEKGERCPWPWEPGHPQNAAVGQYHCPYCGAMVVAGIPHLDYAEIHDMDDADRGA